MYHFNLLTDAEKKNAKIWIVGKHISNGLILLNGTLVVAALMLLSGIYSFQRIVDLAETQNNDAELHNTTIEIDVPQTNARIRALSDVQKNHPNYISFIVQVTDIFPENILVNSLSASYEETTITVSGTAADRDALKNLQFSLENDERFTIEQFPFDSFTQSEEIPFSVIMSFDPAAFMQEEVTEEL